MMPSAHMALTCGTTFMDALTNMVKRKQVIARYTMSCFRNATRKFVTRMQLNGLAEEYSTRLP